MSKKTTSLRLNHIGIATSDPNALKNFFALLGVNEDHFEDVPDQKVMTHFLPLTGAPPTLELLEPTSPESTVAAFLKKRGPGIHHLSFEVAKGELDRLCERIQAGGYRLIYDAPRPGAHGMRVQFVHPSSVGGILVEIMEPSAEM